MKKSTLSFDKLRINYELNMISQDRSPLLVLLHGTGGDKMAWSKITRFLNKHGRSTLAIDLRGHGNSERPCDTNAYSLECFAKDVYHVLKKEKIQKFTLVGHSLGGSVVLVFHKLYPQLAESYILISCATKPPFRYMYTRLIPTWLVKVMDNLLEIYMEDWREVGFKRYKKVIDKGDWSAPAIFSDIAHTSFRSWVCTHREISKFDGRPIAATIKKNTLIVHGALDKIYSVENAQIYHELIKGSKLKIIPGGIHNLVIKSEKETEEAIYSFVSKID